VVNVLETYGVADGFQCEIAIVARPHAVNDEPQRIEQDAEPVRSRSSDAMPSFTAQPGEGSMIASTSSGVVDGEVVIASG
jgi:hypothetical protein